jgi:hypothetical protein
MDRTNPAPRINAGFERQSRSKPAKKMLSPILGWLAFAHKSVGRHFFVPKPNVCVAIGAHPTPYPRRPSTGRRSAGAGVRIFVTTQACRCEAASAEAISLLGRQPEAYAPDSGGDRFAKPRDDIFFTWAEQLRIFLAIFGAERPKNRMIPLPFPAASAPCRGLLRGKGPGDRGLFGAKTTQKVWVIDSPKAKGYPCAA